MYPSSDIHEEHVQYLETTINTSSVLRKARKYYLFFILLYYFAVFNSLLDLLLLRKEELFGATTSWLITKYYCDCCRRNGLYCQPHNNCLKAVSGKNLYTTLQTPGRAISCHTSRHENILGRWGAALSIILRNMCVTRGKDYSRNSCFETG